MSTTVMPLDAVIVPAINDAAPDSSILITLPTVPFDEVKSTVWPEATLNPPLQSITALPVPYPLLAVVEFIVIVEPDVPIVPADESTKDPPAGSAKAGPAKSAQTIDPKISVNLRGFFNSEFFNPDNAAATPFSADASEALATVRWPFASSDTTAIPEKLRTSLKILFMFISPYS
jgi:hypothetical protein